ncbi:MAG TPA: hypothetical protein VFZ64_17995 [Nocardioidaceae bacterium]
MSDPVALTSVVVSGLVALGALAVSFRSGVLQRRHEQRMAHDERSWTTRSDGLFAVVGACRALVDAIDRPGSFEAIETLDLERGDYEATAHEHIGVSEIGVKVGDVADRLSTLVPVVEVYGSAEARAAFHELRRMLRDSDYDPHAADRLAAIRRGKVAAIDAKDYRSAATARRLEREVLEAARARLAVDLDELRGRAETVIEEIRAGLDEEA